VTTRSKINTHRGMLMEAVIWPFLLT